VDHLPARGAQTHVGDVLCVDRPMGGTAHLAHGRRSNVVHGRDRLHRTLIFFTRSFFSLSINYIYIIYIYLIIFIESSVHLILLISLPLNLSSPHACLLLHDLTSRNARFHYL
jgi:hypothetical protein